LLSDAVHNVFARVTGRAVEKVTVPVGRVPPVVKAGATVAVKVTCWSTKEGLYDDETIVVPVAAELTV
jgi:hypothetical protein